MREGDLVRLARLQPRVPRKSHLEGLGFRHQVERLRGGAVLGRVRRAGCPRQPAGLGGEMTTCIRAMGTSGGAAITTNSPWPMRGRRSLHTVLGSPSVSSTPREPGTLEPRATSRRASGGAAPGPVSLARWACAASCCCSGQTLHRGGAQIERPRIERLRIEQRGRVAAEAQVLAHVADEDEARGAAGDDVHLLAGALPRVSGHVAREAREDGRRLARRRGAPPRPGPPRLSPGSSRAPHACPRPRRRAPR